VTPSDILLIVNGLASVLFIALIGAGVFAMARRIILYTQARLPVPVVLRRDFGLFAALALITVEGAILRSAGIELVDWGKVVYVSQQAVVAAVALGYWVTIELFKVDDPKVK
jgi:hypothetical protein